MRTVWQGAWCLVPLGLAFAVQDRFALVILAFAAAQALYVAGWDFVGNVSGQPTLGHALPLGTGAYVAALVAGWSPAPPPIAIACGAGAGALAGALQGALGGRLHRLSLALVTLATAELAHEGSAMLAIAWPSGITVGGDGGIPMIVFPPGEVPAARLAAAVLAAGLFLLLWIYHSGLGLAMRAVRSDERAAAASGLDVVRVRVLAFAIAGGTAGLAGGIVAGMIGRAAPTLLALDSSLFAAAIAGVACPGTIIGPATAAYLAAAAFQWLDVSGAIRLAVYALLLIAAALWPAAVARLGGGRRVRQPLAAVRAP